MNGLNENTQQKLDELRERDEEKAESIRAERRSSVTTYWKLISGLFMIIGVLSGYLLSNLTFMGQIVELKTNQISLQKQINENTALIGKLMDMHMVMK